MFEVQSQIKYLLVQYETLPLKNCPKTKEAREIAQLLFQGLFQMKLPTKKIKSNS